MPAREILKPVDDAVLIPRARGSELFGVSVDTLRRMERAGMLTPIRLSGRPQSWVHYRRAEVEALLEHGVSAAPAEPKRAKLKPLADREADFAAS